jgi:DNA polymerase-1
MLVSSDTEVVRAIKHIADTPEASIDTETSGLEKVDKPFAFSVAGPGFDYYFDEQILDERIWNALSHVGPRTWYLQNAKFDLKMLKRKGVNLEGKFHDITSLGRIVRNDHLMYSLDAQATRELKIPKDKVLPEYIKKNNLYEVRTRRYSKETYKVPQFYRVPKDIVGPYAGLDARLTYDLAKHYQRQITPDLEQVVQLESDLIPVCSRMEERGVRIDVPYTEEAYDTERTLRDFHKATFKHITGNEYVNSAKSLQKAIGVQLPVTEEGNPSLTDDVIEMLLPSVDGNDKKVLETVRLIRALDKRISTYFLSYLDLVDDQGIINPSMWIAGTRTGRFSYSDPNFQNLPKEKRPEYQHIVRRCVVPQAGRSLVSLDYKQMEYMMMLGYANEAKVIARVMNNEDLHKATADAVGIDRDSAKTLNFAILYGAGDAKIALMLGISIAEARTLRYKYFMALPMIERFIDAVIGTGRTRGYVKNWLGRRMYASPQFCYALPNHLIQGGGADVVKRAMVEIDKMNPELFMFLQVHDQLLFDMEDEEKRVWVPEIKRVMESIYPEMNGIRLSVDVKESRQSFAEIDMVEYGG